MDTEDAAERHDAASLELTDISEHIRSRSELFGDCYPFSHEGNLISLKETITAQHRLYTFLLMASHLRFWPRSDRKLFTEDFEVLSAHTLKHLVPTWTIKIMGTAQREEDFPGSTGGRRKKLETFARDLGLRLMMDEDELRHFDAPRWRREARCRRMVCLPRWGSQHARHAWTGRLYGDGRHHDRQAGRPRTWDKRLRGLSTIPCFFTPQHYRLSNKAWVDSTQVHGIFLDRFRILDILFHDGEFQISGFPSMEKVDSIFS